MKRIIIIIIIAVAALALGYAVYSFLEGGQNPSEGTGSSTITATSTIPGSSASSTTQNFPTTDKIVIGTPGGSVTINNPYKNPVYVDPSKRQFFLFNSDESGAYYFAPDSSFVVGIDKGPFSETRLRAEQLFLEKLGINAQDGCKLNVWESVLSGVDPNLAGRNLGLSFCPQGQ